MNIFSLRQLQVLVLKLISQRVGNSDTEFIDLQL